MQSAISFAQVFPWTYRRKSSMVFNSVAHRITAPICNIAIPTYMTEKALCQSPAAASSAFRSLGAQLRRRRLLAGLSQEDVAYSLGVSQTLYSRLERGLNRGISTYLSRIEKIFSDTASGQAIHRNCGTKSALLRRNAQFKY